MMNARELNDQSLENFDTTSTVSTLEPEKEANNQAEWTGPRCEQCDSPLKSDVVAICRKCGWYASLGTFVEVDPNWEADTETYDAGEAAPQKSHLQVWLELLPRWSWVIIASVLAVVVESVVARFVTPADGGLRTVWSLSQLAAGIVLAAACHVISFMVLAAEDAEFGVMDIFLRPLKIWVRAAHQLPQRLWVTNAAACGLTASLMSLIVIGGLPYERLWDWGFQEPVKQNLMGAVMDRAKQLDSRNGADNLEDAISDFAGSQDVEPGADSASSKPAKPRERVDCAIVGYQVDREGRLDRLYLGMAHRKKLVYAGSVAPELPEDQRSALLQSLESIKTLKAFIPVEAQATWVQPNYACRVTYGEKQKNGRLRDVQWVSMLGNIEVP